MNISGIHHIAIIASNYEKSKDFYVRVLGFKLLREQYRKERDSWKLDLLVPDGTQIELFSFPDPPPRSSYPEASGLRHLAFKVSSLESCIEHLTSCGVETQEIRNDDSTGKRFVFFSDPDNLPIELYEV
jgi:glyoxylase I family protein